MLLRPKFPEVPTLPASAVMTSAEPVQHIHPSACSCQHGPAAPERRIAPAVGLGVGAVAAVVVVGVVLTALVTAVAVGAVSVAVAAVVLRSLLGSTHQR